MDVDKKTNTCSSAPRLTVFEKHKQKNYQEWYDILKSKWKNVYTYNYKGYDIITFSEVNHGFGYKIFKDNTLMRERRYVWYRDGISHVFRYIDDIEKVSR